jgi:hypothetical protein
LEIEVEVKTTLSSNFPSTSTFKMALEEALLCFIFGLPEQEEKALEKLKQLITLATKDK